ncbi:hypothetical protein ACQKGI_10085 [Peribacillus muralis]|uniref:Uncharacterized protein n=1 Tax=Peribacillus muralis TaxID=264697 RepID=A0A1B3XTL3_9BACI|nr:hypothetical protein [Peribacillus muralis]AOH56557.1 hypothetical protein ABE28_019495 [Peribacillus muralis]
MEVKHRTLYFLEIMENGEHYSFDYETEDEAYHAFEFLVKTYKDNRIVDKGPIISADNITQLSICKTQEGSVPKCAIANYSPFEWFKDTHEEIKLSAKIYYENQK